MHFMIAVQACNAYNKQMQMTIRNVSREARNRLKAEADAQGKSLNQAAIDALNRGLGLAGEKVKKRDLSFFAMSQEDAKAIEESVAWMDQADLKFQRAQQRHERRGRK